MSVRHQFNLQTVQLSKEINVTILFLHCQSWNLPTISITLCIRNSYAYIRYTDGNKRYTDADKRYTEGEKRYTDGN